ncbi:MAG: hypothetical protein VB070_15050 [Clostridiaceae bacterium]|nr:hypothetical protein [Clostridiaceae bacterium]
MIVDWAIPGISIANGKLQSEYVKLLNLYNDPIARQLSEVKQIKLDLIVAKDLFINIERLEDVETNYVIKYAFWFAGSMTYCRCFNSGKGRNKRLSDKHIHRVNSNLQKIHHEIVLLRNKYFAHADKNEFEHYSIFGILDYDSEAVLGLSSLFDKTIVPPTDFFHSAVELIEDLIYQIAEEEEKITDKLLTHLMQTNIDVNDVIRPANPILPVYKAQLYGDYSSHMFEKGNYTDSLKYINLAIEAVPGIWENHHNRALIYGRLGQYDMAEADERIAMTLRK